jgi:chaperonin GroES
MQKPEYDPDLEEAYITLWHRPRNPVEAAERWKPAQPQTAFILPFLFEGLNAAGIYLDHDFRLPRVFGLVLKTSGECQKLTPGVVCMFRPHAFDEYVDSFGDTLYAIHEKSIRTLLDFSGETVKLNPIWNNIAIEPKKRDEMTAGGIILPQTAADYGVQEGTIAYVSADVTDNRFKIGEKVLFSKFSGSEIKQDDRELMLIKTTDVVAFLEEDPAPVLALGWP